MSDSKPVLLKDMIAELARDNQNAAHRAAATILVKIKALQQAGHTVTMTGDIPGLWRVDDGPELTTNQLLGFWPHSSPVTPL